jgi:hypothetical protein
MTRIVSKRLGSLYRFGRADCWLKVKNPLSSEPKCNTPADFDNRHG